MGSTIISSIFLGLLGRRYINKIYNKNFEEFKSLQKKLLIIKLII
jgi:hypothetical protein